MTMQPHEIPYDFLERTQVITGLRRLADFFTDHPDVPVRAFGWSLTEFPDRSGDEQTQRAEIDRVAAILRPHGGKRIDETDTGGHDRALITFGRITYELVRIPQRARETFAARTSYERNVTVD